MSDLTIERQLINCIGKMCGIPELDIDLGLDRIYRAYDMSIYDGAIDGNNSCGSGETPYEAVMDLLEVIS